MTAAVAPNERTPRRYGDWMYREVTLGLVTAAEILFNLEEGDIVLDWFIEVITASDAATSDVGVLQITDGPEALDAGNVDLTTLGVTMKDSAADTAHSADSDTTCELDRTITGAITVAPVIRVGILVLRPNTKS